MPEWVAGLIFAVFFFTIVGGLWLAKRRHRQRQDRGWGGLAQQLGLRYQPRTEGAELTGVVDGRPVTIETSYHRVGGSISRKTHWKVGLPQPARLQLQVVPRALGTRIGQALGLGSTPVPTGDERFDAAFVVSCQPAEAVNWVFDPTTREALLGMPDFDRVFVNGEVVGATTDGYETHHQRLGWMLRTLSVMAANLSRRG